jgi:hypothetical protein
MKQPIKLNHIAIIVAAIVAFIVSAVWYSPPFFGNAYMKLLDINSDVTKNTTPAVLEIIGEFIRNLIIAYVLAHFVLRVGAVNLKNAVQTGFWIWIGFQAMLLIGAVLHEKMPLALYFIHAGDALVKTLIMAVIIGYGIKTNFKCINNERKNSNLASCKGEKE